MYKKNMTKTLTQKLLLEQYYDVSAGFWVRQDLERLAKDIGLSRQQVYKWLWDKRNMQRKKMECSVKIEEEQLNYYSQSECQKQQFIYNKCRIKVPETLRGAIEYIVDPKVPSWAITILRKEGWQFIKYAEGTKQNNFLIEPIFIADEPPKSQEQEMQLKEYDSPRSVIRCSCFELVKQEAEDNAPILKAKSPKLIKKEVKQQKLFSLKKSKSAPYLQDKSVKTIKKKPVFSHKRQQIACEIYEPSS